jgi:hypothetical protein
MLHQDVEAKVKPSSIVSQSTVEREQLWGSIKICQTHKTATWNENLKFSTEVSRKVIEKFC